MVSKMDREYIDTEISRKLEGGLVHAVMIGILVMGSRRLGTLFTLS